MSILVLVTLMNHYRIVILGQESTEDETFDELFTCCIGYIMEGDSKQQSNQHVSAEKSHGDRWGAAAYVSHFAD